MIDLSVGNWDAISVAELWAEREVCTSAPSTPAPILADHWSGALAQMRHTHETRICSNWSPGRPRGCWSQALKGGCTQSQLWILEQSKKWAHLCSMVFFGQVFIGLNGFHWLPNIGPTMGWYYAISEVYMERQSPNCEQRSIPKQGAESTPWRGWSLNWEPWKGNICSPLASVPLPPRMGKKSDV